jgi:hypothetical protein
MEWIWMTTWTRWCMQQLSHGGCFVCKIWFEDKRGKIWNELGFNLIIWLLCGRDGNLKLDIEAHCVNSNHAEDLLDYSSIFKHQNSISQLQVSTAISIYPSFPTETTRKPQQKPSNYCSSFEWPIFSSPTNIQIQPIEHIKIKREMK